MESVSLWRTLEIEERRQFQRTFYKTIPKNWFTENHGEKMPEDTFEMISSGLFTYLVLYCIEVFGNVFGLDKFDETTRRSPAFTKKDCLKLQILLKKVLKLQMKLPRDFPTKDLLEKSDTLSIHQLIGYHTLVQVYKILNQNI